MDLLDSLRALLRRWPVTLTLLVMTLAATAGALIAIPWQYESKATVVFLSSRKGSQPVGGNPWLAFDASLTITAEVISRGMSDERTLRKLKNEGRTAEFTVGLAQDSRGPLLDITASAPDPEIAQATMETLAALSRERLTEVQQKSSILPDATIRAELVTSTDKAELTPEKKIRMLVVVFAGGMLLTVGVPLFLESLAQKRRRLAQGDHMVTRAGQPPGVPGHPQRVPRPPAPTAARGRPPARSPRPIEPPEPKGYDRGPSPATQPTRPDPRDPWGGGKTAEEHTVPMVAPRLEMDRSVWSDDRDRPRGAPPMGTSPLPPPGGSNGARPAHGLSASPSSQGPAAPSGPRHGAAAGYPEAGGDLDEEPYVVFDPTRPGR